MNKIISGIWLVSVLLLFATFPAEAQRGSKTKGEKQPGMIPGNAGQLIEAKKEAMVGNTKGALEMFRRYVDRFPQDPAGYFELSRLEAARNNYADAYELVRTAATLNPENIWYQLFLAEICQVTAKYPEAIEIYETIVSKDPENLDYYYQLAALYLTTGKYREAVKVYDQIEARAGVSEEISIQKQKIYLRENDLEGAEKELRNLIAANPAESRYYSILAEFYMANDQLEKALETYRKVKEIDPENPYIHMALADYYRKTGNKEKSYEELKLGFANPNLDIDTKVNILLSFYSVNQIYNDLKDEAFVLSKILVETHPRDPKAYSIYGDLLVQDKKYAEARESFLKVLEYDSSRYAVWEEVMRLDLQTEEEEHLAAISQRAIELFPEQPLPYLFSGLANFQLKNYEQAAKVLNNGVKVVVNNDEMLAQFFMYLGDTWHAMQQEELSFTAYEQSLKLNYNNAYVLNNYAYYLSLRGKELEKAEKMAEKAVSLEPENASFQDTYGWVLYKLGRYEDAREWIGKALSDKDGPSADVLEHYGDVAFKLGNTAQAIEYWNMAKKKGGGSPLLEKKINDKKLYE
jgi:tetratricopeptide (TPR) repeat protein